MLNHFLITMFLPSHKLVKMVPNLCHLMSSLCWGPYAHLLVSNDASTPIHEVYPFLLLTFSWCALCQWFPYVPISEVNLYPWVHLRMDLPKHSHYKANCNATSYVIMLNGSSGGAQFLRNLQLFPYIDNSLSSTCLNKFCMKWAPTRL